MPTKLPRLRGSGFLSSPVQAMSLSTAKALLAEVEAEELRLHRLYVATLPKAEVCDVCGICHDYCPYLG